MTDIQNSIPVSQSPSQGGECSVLEGYNICLQFLSGLGGMIKYPLSDKEDMYGFFFGSICMGIDAYAEWNSAIYRVTHVVKERQECMKFSIPDVFLFTIEFCEIFNERWGSILSYLTYLLKDMRNHPEKYPVEWRLWNKSVNDVITEQFKMIEDFIWDAEGLD